MVWKPKSLFELTKIGTHIITTPAIQDYTQKSNPSLYLAPLSFT